MRKIIFSIICVFVIISFWVTNISAGGNIGLSGVKFSLGSLIAEGTLTGLGSTDVTVILDGSGHPSVICTNQGGNQTPGQNPPKVSAGGLQFLFGNDPIRKNGNSSFSVRTNKPTPFLNGTEGGCPNDNWTATIDFVFWTNAAITVKSTATGEVLLKQDYVCITTRAAVSCTPAQ